MAARQFWWPRITEAIQKKCDNCFACKMAGKNIKPNIPKYGKKPITTVKQTKRGNTIGLHRSNY